MKFFSMIRDYLFHPQLDRSTNIPMTGISDVKLRIIAFTTSCLFLIRQLTFDHTQWVSLTRCLPRLCCLSYHLGQTVSRRWGQMGQGREAKTILSVSRTLQDGWLHSRKGRVSGEVLTVGVLTEAILRLSVRWKCSQQFKIFSKV